MKIFRTAKGLQSWRSKQKALIGFVPTMGALHEGHLDLVRKSKRQCELTIVSVFVNPTQFGPREDLKSYPRTEKSDFQKLRDLGVDLVFAPREAKEIYPQNSEGFRVLGRESLTGVLEGKFRPQFFEGVSTVVAKLFQLVRPSKAYFGEKDYQQLLVIESLVKDLFFPIKIVRVKTRREKSGLAMSSRNQYLSSEDRLAASELYHTMKTAPSVAAAKQKLLKLGFKIQYLEVWSEDLHQRQKSNKGRWLAAVHFAGVRLIDNISRKS